VKFTADWCPPCHALEPTLEKLSLERADVLVLSLEVEANPRTAERFGIRSLPTLIAFDQGQPVGQLVGNVSRAKIDDLLGA